MTEPYNLDDEEVLFDQPRRPPSWIGRVRAADAEAENAFKSLRAPVIDADLQRTLALIAIAAELRAARIARRPGAGQSYDDIPGAGQRGC